ncbi:MAG TPA: flagellin [Micromonosporaceae bacterium]|nr:flagellin [Micromonosporaceae bacterium]
MAIQVRATQQSISARVMSGLQNNLTKMGRLQEQLSSGKLITRPSDSPTGTVSAMQLRSEIRSAEQYTRNADDGLGWLSTLDSTLTGSLEQVRRARDLTLQGMSSGAGGSPASRAALRTEVENIRDSLIQLGNTKYLDRPVFGGITPGEVAYEADGTFRAGPVGEIRRTVGDGASVRVDLDGPTAFGEDGADDQLFAVLQSISANLDGDPGALGEDLINLDTAIARLQTVLSGVGAGYNRVEQMRQSADNRVLALKGQLSDVEDIDLPQTIMDVKLQETAYQAALAATARVIQPSLMDYLR